jgi:hypothetical protein
LGDFYRGLIAISHCWRPLCPQRQKLPAQPACQLRATKRLKRNGSQWSGTVRMDLDSLSDDLPTLSYADGQDHVLRSVRWTLTLVRWANEISRR